MAYVKSEKYGKCEERTAKLYLNHDDQPREGRQITNEEWAYIQRRRKKGVRSVRERFNEKWMCHPRTGCWIWVGALDGRGYGSFRTNNITYKAHRVSYELHLGPIPVGAFICHSCDTPACINPEHLWAGTPADNNRDMDAKGRRPVGEHAPGAKLTEADVRAIRADPRTNQRVIGEDYGVTQSQISMVRGRKSWAHVR